MTKKRSLFSFLNAAVVCLLGLAGMSGMASAQGAPGLNTPQKQAITFTFGLGSAELVEKYGQNAASKAKFDRLIGQIADTPSARIDSIVITSYSSNADQIGDAALADRRIQTVRNYVGPVIRQSQLRQAVVITGNIVAKNNLFQPEQIFDQLKKTVVTVYMNGLSSAMISGGQRAGFSGNEEAERYASPFGSSNVFARKNAKQVVEPVVVQPTAIPVTPVQPTAIPVTPVQPTAVPVAPIQPTIPPGMASENTAKNDDLRRYIDSLTMASSGALPTAPVSVPAITEEEPCPQGRDPEMDNLIARLLAEESPAVPVVPVQEESAASQSTTSGDYSKQNSAVVTFEIGSVDLGDKKAKKEAKAADVDNSAVVAFPEIKREAATEKIKVRPVKEPRVPMTLIHPFMGIKTNLVYWAAVAANVELEFYFAKRWSAAVEGVYTNWDMNLYKKHYAVNEVSPEVRFWTSKKAGQYRGFYVGIYGHAGQFDYMFRNKENGYTGDYYGGGIAIGAYLPFTPHFGMELGLRGGYINAKYDTYYYDAPFYMHKCSKETNYLGLTGAKISLVYRFGLKGANRK